MNPVRHHPDCDLIQVGPDGIEKPCNCGVADLERQLAEAQGLLADANARYNKEFHNVDAWHAKWTEQAAQLAEAQAHVRNHHIEACVSCAATESERDALQTTLEQARAALERTHNCATLNSQTRKCEGCFVSETLAALDAGKEAGK